MSLSVDARDARDARRPIPAVPALALLCSALLSAVGSAQSLEVVPGAYPQGPILNPAGGYAEAYGGEPLVLEFSLPGLDHAASQAVAPLHLTFLCVAAGTLPVPIPLSPTASLYLDPTVLAVIPVPPSLELAATIALPVGVESLPTPCQVVDIPLTEPGFPLYASGLITIVFLPPPVQYDDEMRPLGAAAAGTTEVSFDSASNSYLFTHTGSGGVTQYAVDLDLPYVQGGLVDVLETTSGIRPTQGAGMFYGETFPGTLTSPVDFLAIGTHALVAQTLAGDTLSLEYEDTLDTPGGTVTRHRRIDYTLVGKALRIRARLTDDPAPDAYTFPSFDMGGIVSPDPTPSFRSYRIPYMDQIGVTLVDNDWFVGTFVDLFRSQAQHHVPANLIVSGNYAENSERTFYVHDDAGQLRALDDTCWVVVSRDVSDCLVESSAPRSAHADDFARSVGAAFSREAISPFTYVSDRLKAEQMRSWGMSDVLVWKVHWMNYGQNRRATTHVPPNPDGGTEQEFEDLVRYMASIGWRTALYTDFYSLDQAQGFDDNPNYSENPLAPINLGDGVKDSQGEYRLGFGLAIDFAHPELGIYNTRLLAPKRSLVHFEREGGEMVERYGANANYFDIMTIAPPDLIFTGGGQNQGVISGESRSVHDKTIAAAINSYKNLFRLGSDVVNGPIVAEGGFFDWQLRFDSFYAGYIDGAWRTIATGGDPAVKGFEGAAAIIMPDFEVMVARGKMPGLFGMGQYSRFFEAANPEVGLPINDWALAELRATQISYMHNGFFMTLSVDEPADFLTHAQQVKEYYTMKSLADEWEAAGAGTVRYRRGAPGSPWLTLSDALREGNFPFVKPVVRLEFESGLVAVVNHTDELVAEEGWLLPTHGWAIHNAASGYLNVSAFTAGPTGPAAGGGAAGFQKLAGDPVQIELVICGEYEMADGNGTTTTLTPLLGTVTDLEVVRKDTGLHLTELADGTIALQ
jgi:hypothetical protein